MEKNLYGIDESNKVAAIVATGISSVRNIDKNKDDKISTLEILNSVQVNAFKIISNTPDLKMLRKEATDYSEEEKDEIAGQIAEGAEIAKPKARVLFERGLNLTIDIVDFVIDLQKEDAFFE